MYWREVFGGGDAPFAVCFRAPASAARQRLESFGPELRRLSAGCFDCLEEHLVEKLSDLCAPALQRMFEQFRAAHGGGFADFVESGPLKALFERYPILEELAARVCDDWVAAVREFAVRLDHDWEEVLALAGAPPTTMQAQSLRAGLSDPHHGGRTVIKLEFTAGRGAVYKPRGMSAEAALEQTLELLGLRAARSLDKRKYGWQEPIAAEECTSQAMVEAFYRRAGALMSLLYLFRGSDAHMGNVIAVGADPVLVDAECMMQPALLHDAEGDLTHADDGVVAGLMLRTGFLRRPDSGEPDLSGLGGAAGQQTDFPAPEWRRVNTDAMTLRMRAGRIKGQLNRARFRGETIDPLRYGAEFRAGFTAAWRVFADLAHRQGGVEALLNPWREVSVRILLRPTREYVAMINASLRFSCLRNVRTRRERIERMLRAGAGAEARSIYGALETEEAEAIERLDIPQFTIPACGGGMVKIQRCGFDAVRRRLESVSEETLRQAERVLKALWILTDKNVLLH